jgi:fibronectin type 3 domain-containing protein
MISVMLIWSALAAGCGSEDTLNPPEAPTEVSATAQWENSGIRIQVRWTAVEGADSYIVYRSDAADGEYAAVSGADGVSDTSFTDAGLQASAATYYYKVAARNAAGAGAQSSSASVTLAAPETPTGVNATAQSSTNIRVSWSSVSGATGYYVYRSTSFDGEYSQIGSPTTASYTDGGRSPNTTYYYKVAAWNIIGTSSQSPYAYATTPPPPLPAAPTGVWAIVQTSYIGSSTIRSISITWDAVAGATGYIVYRSTSLNGEYSSIGSTTQRSWITSGTRYTTYYFKVAAYNSTGTGPLSSYDSVTY